MFDGHFQTKLFYESMNFQIQLFATICGYYLMTAV